MPIPKRKKSKTAQKVIIPKGMINPNETTIIEIPAQFHSRAIVIAKPKPLETPSKLSDGNRYSTSSNSLHSSTRLAKKRSSTGCIPSSPSRNKILNNESRDSSYCPPCSAHPRTSSQYSLSDLEMTEKTERIELQRNLEDFQKARRKLLATASRMVSGHKILYTEQGSETALSKSNLVYSSK